MKVEFKDKEYQAGVTTISRGYTSIVIDNGLCEAKDSDQVSLALEMGGVIAPKKPAPKQKRGKK